MTSAEFANYAVSQGCEINQRGTAEVIRLTNPNFQDATFNLMHYKVVFPEMIAKACARLRIALPPLR